MTTLLYDGTFEGFLTSVFDWYDRKLADFRIVRLSSYHPILAESIIEVLADTVKSKRVWEGLKKRLSVEKRNELYKTFLSELPEMEQLLINFIQHVFSSEHNIEGDFGHVAVIGVTKIAHKVHREKHRMEAFIRFERTKDELYFSSINPDFNVLPLISSHFKDRYSDQTWLIFDRRRKYGIHYNCEAGSLSEVQLDLYQETFRRVSPTKHLS